jgi:iron complex transport system ATP-binding protein
VSVIEIRGLHAGYRSSDGGWRSALRGVDLSVDEGEAIVLIGPNGSGKTTLLRCIAGTLPASDGQVCLWGRPVANYGRREIARRLAVLPQSLELPPGFRVAEVVAIGRAPHASRTWGSSAEDRSAVERALLDAGATDLAERPVEELSGGERQRVLIALALAQEPELLLLDEPTAHLDVAHGAALLGSVSRLQALRGVTVIVVLHDLGLAAAWAPRVILLDEGRIRADGPPGRALQPGLVRDAYGIAVETARTDSGRDILVPYLASAAADGVHRFEGGVSQLTATVSISTLTPDGANRQAAQDADRAEGPQRDPGKERDMAEKRKADEPIPAAADEAAEAGTGEQDTEGHFMLPDPGAARVLASSRARDIERDARFRLFKKGKAEPKRGR